MKEALIYKIEKLSNKAKASSKKNIKVTLTSGSNTSLNNAIKTKEEGKVFMNALKAL